MIKIITKTIMDPYCYVNTLDKEKKIKIESKQLTFDVIQEKQ